MREYTPGTVIYVRYGAGGDKRQTAIVVGQNRVRVVVRVWYEKKKRLSERKAIDPRDVVGAHPLPLIPSVQRAIAAFKAAERSTDAG